VRRVPWQVARDNLMNTTTYTPVVIAFIVVVALLFLFGARVTTEGMMIGGPPSARLLARPII
jgi:hypothetical protein